MFHLFPLSKVLRHNIPSKTIDQILVYINLTILSTIIADNDFTKKYLKVYLNLKNTLFRVKIANEW